MVAAAKFITLEGGEGCGKSTQLRLLSEAMTAAGVPHVTTREPGGTPLGEAVRELLVKNSEISITPESELLLFQAVRVAHVQQVIRPALRSGKWVLCDRFADSTRAYQGIGKGLGVAFIERLYALTLAEFQPDITVLLDIPPEAGLKRARERSNDETRFEELEIGFHHKVRNGFLELARQEPQRFLVVNALPELNEVHAQLIAQLNLCTGLSLLPKQSETT